MAISDIDKWSTRRLNSELEDALNASKELKDTPTPTDPTEKTTLSNKRRDAT